MIVDSHAHIWDLQKAQYSWIDHRDAVLARNYTIHDLETQLRAVGINSAVLVQSGDNPEDSALMFDAARSHECVLGVVAWVPLDDPHRCDRLLDQWSAEASFCGVRSLMHTRDDPRWLASHAVHASLTLLAERDIPIDVVAVQHEHLRAAAVIGERHPSLRIVLDHLGSPPIGSYDDGTWVSLMAQLGANPRCFAKVSGLYPPANLSNQRFVSDLTSRIDAALEIFRPARLMYGGDWPIVQLRGGYQRVSRALMDSLTALDAWSRARVLSGTAIEFYGLQTRTMR